jgi:uncharacterized small protein (DUF1192 family)
MKRTVILFPGLGILLCAPVFIYSQAAPVVAAPHANMQYSQQGDGAGLGASVQGSEPVSLASVTQLNGMIGQLESTSKTTQADLVKLRIERWKADNASKKQSLSNVDSIQRNLQGGLPAILAQLRAAPEDLSSTFRLYRNLDALYDVLGSVVEGAGAFGSKDDLQALSNDLNAFETIRKQLAERIESLSSAKESEIARLRTDLKAAQAVASPPAKTVVDDTEPVKKPVVKKKAAAKPGTTAPGTKPATAKPPTAPATKPSATPTGQTAAPAQTPATPQ